MFGSLQLNDQDWQAFPLAEDALLLRFEGPKKEALQAVHELFANLQLNDHPNITDRVAGYDSLALYFDAGKITAQELLSELKDFDFTSAHQIGKAASLEIPICYELGTDWDEVERQTGLQREEIIRMHSEGDYTLAFVGFMPGFAYLDGLAEQLHCRRKEDPDTRVPAGAVGIGGMFTGIYSRPSPGGWQIIGRTPLDLFDEHKMPPLKAQAGSRITFRRISEEEFAKLTSGGYHD
jgi:KipI family sensor histidine kinase inhibitor